MAAAPWVRSCERRPPAAIRCTGWSRSLDPLSNCLEAAAVTSRAFAYLGQSKDQRPHASAFRTSVAREIWEGAAGLWQNTGSDLNRVVTIVEFQSVRVPPDQCAWSLVRALLKHPSWILHVKISTTRSADCEVHVMARSQKHLVAACFANVGCASQSSHCERKISVVCCSDLVSLMHRQREWALSGRRAIHCRQ
jgi:hypothetical protein